MSWNGASAQTPEQAVLKAATEATAPAPAPAAPPAAAPVEERPGELVMAETEEAANAAERWVAGLRQTLGPILSTAPRLGDEIMIALRGAGDGSLDWLWGALVQTLVSLAAGFAGWWLVGLLTRRIVFEAPRRFAGTRSERITLALGALLRGTLQVAGFFAAGWLVAILIEPLRSPERLTAHTVVGAAASFLIAITIIDALLSPRRAVARVVPFDDHLARALATQVLAVIFVSNAVTWVCFWMAHFPVLDRAHQLMLLIAASLSAALLIVVAVVHHRPVTAAVIGDGTSGMRRFVGAIWLPLIIVYLLAAWVANVSAVAFSQRLVVGPALAPLLASVVGLVVAGVLIIVHDQRVRDRPIRPRWAALYESFVVGVATLAGLAMLARSWHLFRDEVVGRAATQGFGLLVVAFLAWLAWRAVAIWVEERLEEDAVERSEEHSHAGAGAGMSRLATLLPIARNILFFVILCVAVMVLLADVGVNIGPLFAGAGVVGLAVGFGAQSLIKDMFSGAFFLFDDAFRRGEYVEVSGVMGVVEKISVRSFQLRHQNGPLHTIPFGEIKQLTNFSRDWVIMKLPLRVTFDTDVAKVAKVVKQVGKEMAADPEIGHLFIDPPKSQGVVSMDDSAMVVRIKYMTKPGDQFLVRRHVYQRIAKAFAENGIQFASRQVMVRVVGTDDPDVRQSAAGAALQEELEAVGPKATDDYLGAAQ